MVVKGTKCDVKLCEIGRSDLFADCEDSLMKSLTGRAFTKVVKLININDIYRKRIEAGKIKLPKRLGYPK